MAVELVDVTHKTTGQRTQLPAKSLAHWPDYTTGAADGAFDPSTHNVTDVVAHLAQADPAEQERVRTAEKSGKGRATILDATQEG